MTLAAFVIAASATFAFKAPKAKSLNVDAYYIKNSDPQVCERFTCSTDLTKPPCSVPSDAASSVIYSDAPTPPQPPISGCTVQITTLREESSNQ